MTASKHHCLIVLSSAPQGVSAQSFIQCFTLTHSAFSVALATPQGQRADYVCADEQSRRWVNDFRSKAFAVPLSLEVVDPNRYASLVVPHSPGAAADLASDPHLGQLLQHFAKHKKLVCAVGMGVAALFSAQQDNHWAFADYSLTGSSVEELSSELGSIGVVPEDTARDLGGHFSASGQPEAVHVCVDRHLVTGQNEASTLTAVQNLVLLANQR